MYKLDFPNHHSMACTPSEVRLALLTTLVDVPGQVVINDRITFDLAQVDSPDIGDAVLYAVPVKALDGLASKLEALWTRS